MYTFGLIILFLQSSGSRGAATDMMRGVGERTVNAMRGGWGWFRSAKNVAADPEMQSTSATTDPHLSMVTYILPPDGFMYGTSLLTQEGTLRSFISSFLGSHSGIWRDDFDGALRRARRASQPRATKCEELDIEISRDGLTLFIFQSVDGSLTFSIKNELQILEPQNPTAVRCLKPSLTAADIEDAAWFTKAWSELVRDLDFEVLSDEEE